MSQQKQKTIILTVKVFCGIALAAATLYAHISNQNELTTLRLKIPLLAKELREIQEHNRTLQYTIDAFENPDILQKQKRSVHFSHLNHVNEDEILILPEKAPL